MSKKERNFHFMYSKNTDEEEYEVRKSFTEMLRETILKKGFTLPEWIVWTVILLVILIYIIYNFLIK